MTCWRDFFLALLAALIAEVFFGVAERVCVWLIRTNARRAPPEFAARLEEEWMADFGNIHGKLRRCWFSIDTLRATYLISHSFYSPQVGVWEPLKLRAMDLVGALILLALSMPILLVAMVGIKFEDGWRAPVFIGRACLGRGGRGFLMLAFRANDAGIVGHTIRRLRLDVLPMMLNVLIGDMSFVGPRPAYPLSRIDGHDHELLIARPGIVCDVTAEQMVSAREYVRALLCAARQAFLGR